MTAGNKTYEFRTASTGAMFIQNVIKFRDTVVKMKHEDRRTDMNSPIPFIPHIPIKQHVTMMKCISLSLR